MSGFHGLCGSVHHGHLSLARNSPRTRALHCVTTAIYPSWGQPRSPIPKLPPIPRKNTGDVFTASFHLQVWRARFPGPIRPEPEGPNLEAMASLQASAAWHSSQAACRGCTACGCLLAPGNPEAWLWSRHGQERDPGFPTRSLAHDQSCRTGFMIPCPSVPFGWHDPLLELCEAPGPQQRVSLSRPR